MRPTLAIVSAGGAALSCLTDVSLLAPNKNTHPNHLLPGPTRTPTPSCRPALARWWWRCPQARTPAPMQAFLHVTESPYIGAALGTGTLLLVGLAAAAGPATWADFGALLRSSKAANVTAVDWCILTLLTPALMLYDAHARQPHVRWHVVALLGLLPVLGPCVYLYLRSKTYAQQVSRS